MGVLVLLSLVLITVSFRSSALDGVQGTAASVLRPFEVAADRVARPFRDTVSWTRGLIDAKSENQKLRKQIADLRQQLILDEGAVQENVQLKAALNYHGPASIANFHQVRAAVARQPAERDRPERRDRCRLARRGPRRQRRRSRARAASSARSPASPAASRA